MVLLRGLAFVATLCVSSHAFAQPAKVHRIGVLANTVPAAELVAGTSTNPAIVALLDGLRARGWIPGKNVEMVWRSAESDYDRQPQQARELAATCDVLVVYGMTGLMAAMSATKTVPIVMAASFVNGPLKDDSGMVRIASLAQPGGNVTGLTLAGGAELSGKRLQLLKLAVPHARRVAILGHDLPPASRAVGTVLRKIAETLSIEFVTYSFHSSTAQLEPAFAQMARDGVDAVWILESAAGHLPHVQKVIHRLAERNKLPVMHDVLAAADSGGLMSYGPDIHRLFKRAPYFIDRILRGTKPGDIPIEQPVDFDLRVNLKAAKAIGVSLPQLLLVQANRIIE